MTDKNILTKKQGGISLQDSAMIALSKSIIVDGIATPFLSRFTGGNPLVNGISKVVLAGVVSNMAKGQFGGIASASLMISAGDEIVGSFFGAKKSPTNQGATTANDDSFGQSNKTPSSEVFI